MHLFEYFTDIGKDILVLRAQNPYKIVESFFAYWNLMEIQDKKNITKQ